MHHDFCNPLTMKIMALGRPLHEAEQIAAVIIIWVVMIGAMTGLTISIAGVPQRDPDNGSGSVYLLPLHGTGPVSACEISPAVTGAVAKTPRSLLQR